MRMNEFAKEFIAQSRTYLSSDFLPKIERSLEGLTDEDVWWRSGEESNSIGNLLLHLEGSTRMWITDVAGGSKHERNRQQEFDERKHVSKSELLDRMKRMLGEADAALAGLRPEDLLEKRQSRWGEVSVFYAVYHAVEHFSMHTGQILMLAKMRLGRDLRLSD
jgi:Uncharacterized protein conserved in bacteria